ncbi:MULTISPECIES: hypothetical protein [Acinetobacter calcoaceticus/baumannii complex]|uniref:hypothetical protein n=1 Tax=Acinetobacter calcoaceticus/baumannii complex TaxID=909768 RepID=UPI000B8CED62|nr:MULTISPECIES: hypothetical protein [Acinetobacter calcoaceticus/baumannii complex]MCJ9007422.1 hypothetical protein [Acinetobacter baumannii]MCJ9366763.1 hypothetical protein [Acinetobacter baumannii]MCJ9400291.1 hypothetical protein [Acinetobacter baumannii]MCJ9460796.1 hypothetical protein [Acinetobacter baumannii]MDH2636136.1 hypothetical protein [Acinetobacter nosocomialis]
MALAKLKLFEQDGKLYFDSSRDRVLSFIKTIRWSQYYPANHANNGQYKIYIYNVYDAEISPNGTYARFTNVNPEIQLQQVVSTFKYFSGYLEITLVVNNNFTNAFTLNFDLKIYRR